jgi:hypothetical protein
MLENREVFQQNLLYRRDPFILPQKRGIAYRRIGESACLAEVSILILGESEFVVERLFRAPPVQNRQRGALLGDLVQPVGRRPLAARLFTGSRRSFTTKTARTITKASCYITGAT